MPSSSTPGRNPLAGRFRCCRQPFFSPPGQHSCPPPRQGEEKKARAPCTGRARTRPGAACPAPWRAAREREARRRGVRLGVLFSPRPMGSSRPRVRGCGGRVAARCSAVRSAVLVRGGDARSVGGSIGRRLNRSGARRWGRGQSPEAGHSRKSFGPVVEASVIT